MSEIDTNSLMFRAAEFTCRAHRGQFSKLDGESYANHLFRTAALMVQMGCSEVEVAAGLLHDTLEDTQTLAGDILELDPDVLILVAEVSERKALPYHERKAEYIKHLQTCSEGAVKLAYCDKLDQLRGINRFIRNGWLSPLQAIALMDRKFTGGAVGSVAFYRAVLLAVEARGLFNTIDYSDELSILMHRLSP